MTKPLWAPWRLEYITQADEETGCIFCRAAGGDDEEGLVVNRGEHAFVLLNKFPYSSGHLMVIVAPDSDVRERAVQALRQSGIQSSMHYPCIADFTGFAAGSGENLELTRQFTRRAITLPLYPTMDPDRIKEIVEVLRAVNAKPEER